MKLAQNETILKEWNYGQRKCGVFRKEITECILVVTNKRIIATEQKNAKSGKELNEEIMMLKGIVGVDASLKTKSNFLPIVMIIIGIIWTIFLIGIPLWIKGIKLLNQVDFKLNFTTEGLLNSGLQIGFTHMVNGKKKKKKTNDIFKANKVIINEIIEEIGSIVIENQ